MYNLPLLRGLLAKLNFQVGGKIWVKILEVMYCEVNEHVIVYNLREGIKK